MTKHFHWLLLVKNLIFHLYDLITSLLVLFFLLKKLVHNQSLSLILFISIIICYVGYHLLSYWFTTYQIEKAEITLKSGILFKSTIHIPYAKIQSIERIQPFYLQPLKLVELKIATSGHDKESPVLKLVPIIIATEIEKRQIQHQREVQVITLYPHQITKVSDTNVPANTSNMVQTTYAISWHNLVLYGLTSISLLPTIIFVGIIWSKISSVIPDAWLNYGNALFVKNLFFVILILIILVIFLGSLTSFVITLIVFYHHQASRSNNTITITKGLLKTSTVNFDHHRIQAVMLEQTLIRRLFNIYTVSLALSSNTETAINQSDLVLIPVIEKRKLKTTLAQLLPEYDFNDFNFVINDRNHFGYFYRYALLWLSWLPLLAIPLYFGWLKSTLLIIVILLVIAFIWAKLANHDLGFQLTKKQLNIQNNRFFTKKITLIKNNKLQTLSLSNSILMAPKGLKHLTVTIRKGTTGYETTLRYLTPPDYELLTNWYTTKNKNIVNKI